MVLRSNEFSREALLEYSAEKVFSVVLDVEKYPEFLPWCRSVEVKSRHECGLVAVLHAKFLAFTGAYTSDVTFSPPRNGDPGWIKAESKDGVFKFLKSSWNFEPQKDGGTLVRFSIKFSFKNAALQCAFEVASKFTEARIMNAFVKRVRAVCGSGTT